MDTHLLHMGKIKALQFILLFMILEKNVSSLTLKTEEVVVISKEDESIILNCTYQLSSRDEIILATDIRWRIKVENEFKDVAIFSPPGLLEPYIEKTMEDLYKNRTELIAPINSQLSAVMIIKSPVCTDEGTYQCWIQYRIGTSVEIHIKNVTTFVQFSGTAEAREPTEFLVHPNEPEEKQSITLTCNADVGRPRGNIQIWKIFQILNTSDLIYTSNSSNDGTENCMEYVNVTVLVTRDDDGALFRCSSQNNFTQDPGPSREWPRISVIYGPDKPAITLEPPKTMYSVGDPLTIRCKTASNPPPVFTWTFRLYNKTEEMSIEHTDKDTNLLVFESVQTKNAGTYTCTAINTARPNNPNKTTSVSVYIKNSERIFTGCNQCGYVETCQQSNERTICTFNIWVLITVIFIFLSVTFAVSSGALIMRRKRTHENRRPIYDVIPVENNGGYVSPASLEYLVLNIKPEENHGGYITPTFL